MIINTGQYWFVTITPYGRDIEPNVPDKHRLLADFRTLSRIVGVEAVGCALITYSPDELIRDEDRGRNIRTDIRPLLLSFEQPAGKMPDLHIYFRLPQPPPRGGAGA